MILPNVLCAVIWSIFFSTTYVEIRKDRYRSFGRVGPVKMLGRCQNTKLNLYSTKKSEESSSKFFIKRNTVQTFSCNLYVELKRACSGDFFQVFVFFLNDCSSVITQQLLLFVLTKKSRTQFLIKINCHSAGIKFLASCNSIESCSVTFVSHVN